jgi:competence protein ComEC
MSFLPYAFLGSFLTTLFFLQWYRESAYALWIWLLLAVLTICGIFTKRWITAASLGIACAFLSVQLSAYIPDDQSVERYTGSTITLRAVVADQPDNRQTRMQYTLATESILTASGESVPVHGKILLIDRAMEKHFEPGDEIETKGKLMIPKEDEEFSYKSYLELSDIHATINSRDITFIASTSRYRLTRWLWFIRKHFEERIAAVYPEPASALLAGLLTGSRQGLPPSVMDDFRRTGLTHIIAISGTNITIIVSVIGQLLFFLPLRWRFAPSVVIIVLFTMLVGASASVVRAAIMGILGLIALQNGRLRHARLAILWTAFFMLMWNPLMLWYDMGFQLSFLAVIGLVECTPLLKRPLKHVPETFGIRDALTATLSAQIMATPWIAARFGLISLISPIPNIIIAPLIPAAMLLGFIGTMAGWIWVPLGQLLGFPGAVLLEMMISITRFFAAFPFSAIEVSGIGWKILTLYYVSLVILLYRVSRLRPVVSTGPAVEENRDLTAKPRHTNRLQRNKVSKAKRMAHDKRSRFQFIIKFLPEIVHQFRK